MNDKVNVLLVDDQPAKLLANEEILRDLGENLIKAASAREALEFLLKNDAAVVLIDVCMPELDGFQLAAMIREHPRFQKTAIIFISAVQVDDVDRVRGYEMGAVDYVPVPVVPAVLRAKVKIFAELYRKTRQLERLNAELERRVTERTAELEASNVRLLQSEQGRSLALAAGQMGSWDFDPVTRECKWDEGQHHIFGVERERFQVTVDNIRAMVHPEDWDRLQAVGRRMAAGERTVQTDFRVVQPGGSVRWCTGTAAASFDAANRLRTCERRHHRRHRAQGSRTKTRFAGAGSRSSRPQCAGRRSIDRPADAREQRRRLRGRGRGADQGAGAGARAAVGFALAQRRSRRAGGGRTGSVPGWRGREGRGHRTERVAAAAYGAGAGAGLA